MAAKNSISHQDEIDTKRCTFYNREKLYQSKGSKFMNQNTDINQANNKRTHYFDKFRPKLIPQNPTVMPELWFVFHANRILLKEDDHRQPIPSAADFDGQSVDFRGRQYLGEVDGFSCWCMETQTEDSPVEGMSFEIIRSLVTYEDGSELFKIAGFAYHIMNWSRLNTFCGRCGAPMKDKGDERAKICLKCGSIVYPRISPATITAVIKGDEILLAHNNSFRDGRYSLISGFVEPGETLEDCVKREIFEEIGIQVKNLHYFGSQPWPFPDSLMTAFTAEYDSGEIKIDGVEIGDAKWYKRGSLPDIPGTESIAGRIIRWFQEDTFEQGNKI